MGDLNVRVASLFVLLVACKQASPAPGVTVETPGSSVQVQGSPSGDPSVARPAPGVVVQNSDPGRAQVQVQGPNGAVNVGVVRDPATGERQVNIGGIQVNVPANGAAPAPTVAPAAPGAQTVHAPVVCSGAESVTLTDVIIANPQGPAVDASGACTVTLTRCTLSGTIGVNASGGASVTLTGGSVAGAVHSLMATGSAQITTTGTSVTGPTHHSGLGAVTQG